MLQHIDIFHFNGKQLLTRNFSDVTVEKQILSDFLLTVSSFAKNICHSQIKHVKLNKFQTFIQIHEPFMMAITLDLEPIPEFLQTTVELISQQFNLECNLMNQALQAQQEEFITKLNVYLENLCP